MPAAAAAAARAAAVRRVYPPCCAHRMSRSYVGSQPTSRADLYEFILVLVSVTTIRPATARIPAVLYWDSPFSPVRPRCAERRLMPRCLSSG